jgi:adenosylcobyric acid synthase
MLGRWLHDPNGIEGGAGSSPGLGLLPMETVLEPQKVTRRVTGRVAGVEIEGYEIHCGRSSGVEAMEPLIALDEGRTEGVRAGRVLGSYVHGLFDAPGAVEAVLGPVRHDVHWPVLPSQHDWRQEQFGRLADHLSSCLDIDRLLALAFAAEPEGG